jgi:hypothetical protein
MVTMLSLVHGVLMVFEWFNILKTDVWILGMIQEAGALQHLEMQTQSEMSVKW